VLGTDIAPAERVTANAHENPSIRGIDLDG